MIYLTIQNFETNVHEIVKPVLRETPFVLANQEKVTHINHLALKRGVRVGMSTNLARSKVFGLSVLKQRVRLIQNFSEELYSLLSSYTLHIEPVGTSSTFLYVDSVYSAYELEKKVEDIKRHIKQNLELCASIGIGSTKIAAQLAGTIASPGETLFLQPGNEKAFISSLPISLLPGLGNRSSSLLSGFGITTIGAFAELPIQEAERLFGTYGKKLHTIANGVDERKIIPPSYAHTRSKSHTLLHPSHASAHLISIVSFLSYSLTREATHDGVKPTSIKIRLHDTERGIRQRQRSLSSVESASMTKFISCLVHDLVKEDSLSVYRVSVSIQGMQPIPNSKYFSAFLNKKNDVSKKVHTKIKQNKTFGEFSLPLLFPDTSLGTA